MPFSKGDKVRIKDYDQIVDPLCGIYFVAEMLSMCGKEAVIGTVINYYHDDDNILLYRIGDYNYLEEWLEPVIPDNPFRLPFGTVLKCNPQYTVRGYGYWDDGDPVYIVMNRDARCDCFLAYSTNKEEGV